MSSRTLEYSRPSATAARLGDDAPDRHRFLDKRVLLTGDSVVLATANGRIMLLTALRLLPRLTPNVTVVLPHGFPALVEEVTAEAERIAFGGRIDVRVMDPDQVPEDQRYDAVLSVGSRGIDGVRHQAGDTWTEIASNGWCVWVLTGRGALGVFTMQTNPVGAVAAASLGVAEIFKTLIALKQGRGAPADGSPFSLFTYRSGSDDPGPVLPEQLLMDGLLVGVGAIGNGIVAILCELPVTGRLLIVDRQQFGRENLGTCVLLGPSEVGLEKAKLAMTLLRLRRPELDAIPITGDVIEVLSSIGPVPPVVLNGLDNPDARRAVQGLWADITVDGAIGDFMCQVSRHPGDPSVDVACLRCLFAPDVGPRAEVVSAVATGLRPERVLESDAVVRVEDVDAAPPERREALRAHIGQKIAKVTCSVTREELAAAISEVTQREGFEPSAPFVATCSAAMVVGEWIKTVLGSGSVLEPRFQFDVLRGLGAGVDFPEGRRAHCDCVQRRGVIERVRAARSSALLPPDDQRRMSVPGAE